MILILPEYSEYSSINLRSCCVFVWILLIWLSHDCFGYWKNRVKMTNTNNEKRYHSVWIGTIVDEYIFHGEDAHSLFIISLIRCCYYYCGCGYGGICSSKTFISCWWWGFQRYHSDSSSGILLRIDPTATHRTPLLLLSLSFHDDVFIFRRTTTDSLR